MTTRGLRRGDIDTESAVTDHWQVPAAAATDDVQLNPEEHCEYRWCSFEEALALVHYRGLKDGLRSTLEYITGVQNPARELQLL